MTVHYSLFYFLFILALSLCLIAVQQTCTTEGDQACQSIALPVVMLGTSPPLSSAGDTAMDRPRVVQRPATTIQCCFSQQDIQDSDFHRHKVLGKGTSSVVTLATHLPSGMRFALKEILRDKVRYCDYFAQLKLEINIHRQLRHPHVVRLYSYYETPTSIVLILEYCEKGTLMGVMQRCPSGRLSEATASTFTRHVAKGLCYLHTQEIAHRDVKLENILVDERGVAKIADFGWSRVMVEQSSSAVISNGSLTDLTESSTDKGHEEAADLQVGRAEEKHASLAMGEQDHSHRGEENTRLTVCGTLDYLSPEMLTGHAHSKKTDVWSLGILVAEMLLGKPLFYHPSEAETVTRIRSADPHELWYDAVASPRLTFSAEAESFIFSLLQRLPSDRPDMNFVLRHPWLTKKRARDM